MPGFSAEAALYQTRASYGSLAAGSNSSGEQRVVPQLPAGEQIFFECNTGCEEGSSVCQYYCLQSWAEGSSIRSSCIRGCLGLQSDCAQNCAERWL